MAGVGITTIGESLFLLFEAKSQGPRTLLAEGPSVVHMSVDSSCVDVNMRAAHILTLSVNLAPLLFSALFSFARSWLLVLVALFPVTAS